jgi:hypothetical protein
MYFGLSLARVGADFRGIIAPVFTRTIKQNFEGSLRRATKEFESQVIVHETLLQLMPFDTININIKSYLG